MINNNKKTLGMEIIGLVCAVIGTIIGGFAVMCMWKWFVSDTFNIIEITFWQAVGLDLLITYLTSSSSDDLYKYSEDPMEDTVAKSFVAIFSPIVVFALAYIVQLFI